MFNIISNVNGKAWYLVKADSFIGEWSDKQQDAANFATSEQAQIVINGNYAVQAEIVEAERRDEMTKYYEACNHVAYWEIEAIEWAAIERHDRAEDARWMARFWADIAKDALAAAQ